MKLFLLLLVLSTSLLNSNEELQWKKEVEIDAQPLAWSVDPLGNLIYAEKDVIYKLDTSFNIQFKQSIKEFGNITEIDASHAQKSMVFSEDQQQVVFLDNTLTPTNNGIDLGKDGISYASHVSYSNQPTRYWVYDLDNFKLWLFDDLKQQPTYIENLNGVLNGLNVDQLFETENKLFIWDKHKGVYVFDIYGSLVNKYELVNAEAVAYNDGNLFYVKDMTLFKITAQGKEIKVNFPEKKILQMHIEERNFFVQTEKKIIKYSLRK